MATITVVGRAQVSVQPDQVSLALTVEEVRLTATEALAEVATRARTVLALLEELGIGPAARAMAGVSVSEAGEHRDGTWQHRGWRASERITVQTSDAAVAGRLLGEAVERASARVEGPWWTVSQEHPARTEALASAAADARVRAESLAGGLGVRLGALVDAVESGGQRPEPRGGAMRVASADVPFEPGEVAVAAAVSVTWQVEQA
jgi:hypothetical protein